MLDIPRLLQDAKAQGARTEAGGDRLRKGRAERLWRRRERPGRAERRRARGSRCWRTARRGRTAPTTPPSSGYDLGIDDLTTAFGRADLAQRPHRRSPPSGCRRCDARCRPIRPSAADGPTRPRSRPPRRHETGPHDDDEMGDRRRLALGMRWRWAALPPQAAARAAGNRRGRSAWCASRLRPIAGGIVASGMLIPRNEVAVNPDLAGYRVSKVCVDEGAWVKAGQPLAEMDGSILRAQLDQQTPLVAAAEGQRRPARGRSRAGSPASTTRASSPRSSSTARRFAATQRPAPPSTPRSPSAQEMQTRLDHMVVRAPVVRPGDRSATCSLGDISGGGATRLVP